jgi:hypothetical protein
MSRYEVQLWMWFCGFEHRVVRYVNLQLTRPFLYYSYDQPNVSEFLNVIFRPNSSELQNWDSSVCDEIIKCLQILDTVFSSAVGRWQCYRHAVVSVFSSQNCRRWRMPIFLNVCQSEHFSIHLCVPQVIRTVRALQVNTCSVLQQR